MANDTATAIPTRRPSPLFALLWEEWRQTRRGILTGLAWALPLILLTVFGNERPPRDAYFPAFALFVWLAGTLLFSGYGRNDLHVTFPRRLFVLPLGTDSLVLVRMGYSVFVMALILTGVGWLISPLGSEGGLPYVPVLAVLGMLYLFALGWAFGRRPVVAVVVAVPLWLLVAVLFRAMLEVGDAVVPGPFAGPGAVIAAAVPVAALLAAIAWAGVVYDRNGRLFTANSLGEGIQRIPRLLGRNATGFVSAHAAQTWLEWRRRGRWVVVFCFGTFLFVAVFWLVLAEYLLGGDGPAEAAVVSTLAGTIAAGFYQLLVNERDRVSGLSRFAHTRPLSTAALASARLKALFAGMLAAYAVMGALAFSLVGAFGNESLEDFLEDMYPQRRVSAEIPQAQPPVFRRESRDDVPEVLLQLQRQLQASAATAPQPEISPAQGTVQTTPEAPLAAPHSNGAAGPAQFGFRMNEALRPGQPGPPLSRSSVPPATARLPQMSRYAEILWLLLIPVLTFYIGWVVLTQPLPAIVLALTLASAAESKASPYAVDTTRLLVSFVIFVATAVLFRKAYRLKLLRGSTLRLVLLAWPAIYILLALCTVAFDFDDFSSKVYKPIPGANYVFLFALALLPLIPFATTPLSIHRQRHG